MCARVFSLRYLMRLKCDKNGARIGTKKSDIFYISKEEERERICTPTIITRLASGIIEQQQQQQQQQQRSSSVAKVVERGVARGGKTPFFCVLHFASSDVHILQRHHRATSILRHPFSTTYTATTRRFRRTRVDASRCAKQK